MSFICGEFVALSFQEHVAVLVAAQLETTQREHDGEWTLVLDQVRAAEKHEQSIREINSAGLPGTAMPSAIRGGDDLDRLAPIIQPR